MDKKSLETKIRNLEQDDKVLRKRLDAIRSKYERPTQWMKDPDWVAISGARLALADGKDDLITLVNEIEDQEWSDRMAAAYPDGEV